MDKQREGHVDARDGLLGGEDTTRTSYISSRPVYVQSPSTERASTPRKVPKYLPRVMYDNQRAIYTSIPLISATLWTTMMLYFLISYLTLPRLNGRLPRIGYSYAKYPYISCVGGVRLPSFRGFCITVAVFNSTSFALDLYLTSSITLARGWQWSKAFSSWISSIFLILLSYYSVNTQESLHLYFTSVQIIGTGLARAFDGLQQNIRLGKSPGNPYITRPNFVKKVAAIIALPSSIMAVIGIYGCRDGLQVINPGTTCHKLVSVAAPAEWVLSVTWIIYMLAISMDLHYADKLTESLQLLERRDSSDVEQIQIQDVGGGKDPKYKLVSTTEEEES